MQNKKIGITAVALTKDLKNINFLTENFDGEVLINYKLSRFTKEELISFLQKCDFAIVGLDKIDDYVLSRCPNLKIMCHLPRGW